MEDVRILLNHFSIPLFHLYPFPPLSYIFFHEKNPFFFLQLKEIIYVSGVIASVIACIGVSALWIPMLARYRRWKTQFVDNSLLPKKKTRRSKKKIRVFSLQQCDETASGTVFLRKELALWCIRYAICRLSSKKLAKEESGKG